jgi:hypothetical protein
MLEYIGAIKTVIDIFKGIKSELPAGEKAEKAQAGIDKAEAALKTAEADVAKTLGFKLCKCTFPPQIMLWKENLKTNVCPSCGHEYPPKPKIGELKPGRFGGYG